MRMHPDLLHMASKQARRSGTLTSIHFWLQSQICQPFRRRSGAHAVHPINVCCGGRGCVFRVSHVWRMCLANTCVMLSKRAVNVSTLNVVAGGPTTCSNITCTTYLLGVSVQTSISMIWQSDRTSSRFCLAMLWVFNLFIFITFICWTFCMLNNWNKQVNLCSSLGDFECTYELLGIMKRAEYIAFIYREYSLCHWIVLGPQIKVSMHFNHLTIAP